MTAPTRHAHGHVDGVVGESVIRFDRVERVLHWVTAAAVSIAVTTGFILYVEPLAVAVGRRDLVKTVHVVAGLASVAPTVLAVLGPWGAGLRRDVHRFANWHDDDVSWFRRSKRQASETGKFNGGQKANAVVMGSALAVLAMTGGIMRWFGPFPLEWRTGATFVHDWVAFGLWFLIPAHVIKALTTPGSLRGMWTGWTSKDEARRRPRWWASIDGDEPR